MWRLVDVGVDGTVAEHALHEGPHRLYPNAWSPDGRHIVFQEERPETGWDLFVLDVDAAAMVSMTKCPMRLTIDVPA